MGHFISGAVCLLIGVAALIQANTPVEYIKAGLIAVALGGLMVAILSDFAKERSRQTQRLPTNRKAGNYPKSK